MTCSELWSKHYFEKEYKTDSYWNYT